MQVLKDIMTFPVYFDSKKSLHLYSFFDNFELLKNLYIKKKFPKVLMLTGIKGSGKSTLINHLMFYIFDKNNYNIKINKYNPNSFFYSQFINNIYPNIIYLSGTDFKSTKIEDIRNLKKQIFKTVISDMPRFIILDDVELFNKNSLNALLKTIEEPSENNYFLLINNKTKPLIETIQSRCLEIKILLNEKKRISITESLIKTFDIDLALDPYISKISPGYFIKFNYIFKKNNISQNGNFLENLAIFLNLYKKNKDIIYIDVILFLTNNYFNTLKNKNSLSNLKIIEQKNFIFDNINKFFLYNLNQNTLLNSINNRINDE